MAAKHGRFRNGRHFFYASEYLLSHAAIRIFYRRPIRALYTFRVSLTASRALPNWRNERCLCSISASFLLHGICVSRLFEGQMDEPAKKKLKTIDSKDQKEENPTEEEEEEPALGREDADMYEHIQEAKEQGDTQTLDTATKVSSERTEW